MSATVLEAPAILREPAAPPRERRGSRRTKIHMMVRVCPEDPRLSDEVRPIRDFSRTGIYFTTLRDDYRAGQLLQVFFPYCPSSQNILRTSYARVVRVVKLSPARWGVAIEYLLR